VFFLQKEKEGKEKEGRGGRAADYITLILPMDFMMEISDSKLSLIILSEILTCQICRQN
jgi:hypothetical protein